MMMDWIWLYFFCLLHLKKETANGKCICPYTYANADIEVDSSTAIGTVIHTMNIEQLDLTTTSAVTSIGTTPLPLPVPRIELVTNTTRFELHPVNNRQVILRECLWSRGLLQYELPFNFNCTLFLYGPNCNIKWNQYYIARTLTIQTIYALPIYTGVEQSYVFNLANNQNVSFVELFKIEITNDEYFGGCGSFECEARCLHDDQIFFVDEDNYNLMANRTSLIEGFTYTIDISCCDSRNSSVNGFYDNQTFIVNVIFSRYTETVTERTITTNASNSLMTTAMLPSTTSERNISPTASVRATTLTTQTTLANTLSTVTCSTIYSQYNYFDDVWEFVAVTTSIVVVVIVITACISIKGYTIHRTRMQVSREVPM